ncbi:uncharacterized protein [Anoplolepis gracilipes]|uniref:uncharacterized protein n=1 Tax=Anoplolepis gracilipes TaxID=354296 RepID=UPI003BA3680B
MNNIEQREEFNVREKLIIFLKIAENTNGTDTVGSVAIDISSLYTTLKHDYEGSNIANIITQLLHIYQPKDGITAYECVLKKVQDLLKDCNSRKKQLLLSIIPVPENVPDHMIKEVFHKITGFIKLNLQENNMFQNMFNIKNVDGIMDNNISLSKQSFLYNKNASNFKSSLSEAFSFRGFPENEISTIHNHVKNVNHLYKIIEYDFPRSEILTDVSPNSASYINRQADSLRYQLSNNPKNWLDRNNRERYQMSFCQQYLLNNKKYIPTKISTTNESNLWYSSSQTIYQDTCSINTYKDSEIVADLWQDKIPRQFNNVKYEHKKSKDNKFEKDKKFSVPQMIIDIDQNATIKQTIKDNMDVCWTKDQNIIVEADDLLPTVRDKLKTSLKNFSKRAQEGIFIKLSAFPRTRSHPQSSCLNLICFTSKDQKPGIPRKVSKQNFTSSVSNDNSNSCLFLNQQNTNINLKKNQKESDEKTKQKAFTFVSGLQTKCNIQKLSKATKPQLQQNNLDIMEKKVITLECKENNPEESMHGCKITRPKDVNPENNFQAHSMSQLAAYKKHYYDTLLSVQRAKVAVTNTLASSSDHLTGYDDPYYSNYIDQQQHLFHQQRHFMTRPQFLTYPAELSGLSNVHANQYSWAKSVYKYLLLKQLRLQQQTSPLYARNQDGWIHRYIGPVYPYSFTSNESVQTKHFVRRKSLEDIVGKLKEIERNNVNN